MYIDNFFLSVISIFLFTVFSWQQQQGNIWCTVHGMNVSISLLGLLEFRLRIRSVNVYFIMLFLSLEGITMKYCFSTPVSYTKTSSFSFLFACYRNFTAFKQYTITFYSFHVDCDAYMYTGVVGGKHGSIRYSG